ncbi:MULTISPECIES: hypothetical protein [Cyanophyceae]|uniref:hypothetical protein n=1 Tax=Cyanophyceae TaxID=3028117 RepID=UPI00168A2922|nr:hypothetical protein [Trichocoleus sp. FACHB-40]MBD2001838.1 hypothetical protein [Trichocoleus sp. FACHB-40]
MNEWYRKDLVYIHDVGFRSYVLQAMPGILAILKQHGTEEYGRSRWITTLNFHR